MKITTIIRNNSKNSSAIQNEDVAEAAERLKLTHGRLIAELQMKQIDLNARLRKHMASVNVHGDIDMWSVQLVDLKLEIIAMNGRFRVAQEIKEDLFTGEVA